MLTVRTASADHRRTGAQPDAPSRPRRRPPRRRPPPDPETSDVDLPAGSGWSARPGSCWWPTGVLTEVSTITETVRLAAPVTVSALRRPISERSAEPALGQPVRHRHRDHRRRPHRRPPAVPVRRATPGVTVRRADRTFEVTTVLREAVRVRRTPARDGPSARSGPLVAGVPGDLPVAVVVRGRAVRNLGCPGSDRSGGRARPGNGRNVRVNRTSRTAMHWSRCSWTCSEPHERATMTTEPMAALLACSGVAGTPASCCWAGTFTFWSLVWPDGHRHRRLLWLSVVGAVLMILTSIAEPAIRLTAGGQPLDEVVPPLAGAAILLRLAILVGDAFFLVDVVRRRGRVAPRDRLCRHGGRRGHGGGPAHGPRRPGPRSPPWVATSARAGHRGVAGRAGRPGRGASSDPATKSADGR